MAESNTDLLLSQSLLIAYELADCDDEAALYEAYIFTKRNEETPKATSKATSSSSMMMEIQECLRINACDRDAGQLEDGTNLIDCDGNANNADIRLGQLPNSTPNVVGLSWTGWDGIYHRVLLLQRRIFNLRLLLVILEGHFI